MFDSTMRRIDTLTLVAEQRVVRDIDRATFEIVGGAVGWHRAAMTHLAEFHEAGLVEDAGALLCAGRRIQRLTVAGKFLLRRWMKGPTEAVVTLPANCPDAKVSDVSTLQVNYSPESVDGYAVFGGFNETGHDRAEDRVALLNPDREVLFNLPPEQARQVAAALIGAAWSR